MDSLLELREKIKGIYSKNEVFIMPVIKFMFAYLIFCMVNGSLGYMTQIDNVGIVLMAALMCSFLPLGCISIFAALFAGLHAYALSMDVAIVVVGVIVIVGLMFFRFGNKETLLLLGTIVALGMKIPCVIPVAAGLVATPIAILPVCSGVVLYYVVRTVSLGANEINTLVDEGTGTVVKYILDSLLNQKAMLLLVFAFAVTIIMVYVIRRLAIDYSWTIAMAIGVAVNFFILLIGDAAMGSELTFFGILIGSVLAFAVAKVVEFFRFCVDYDKVEKVQFEDDEYYYYVKAVPKKGVPKSGARRAPSQARPSDSYEQPRPRTSTPRSTASAAPTRVATTRPSAATGTATRPAAARPATQTRSTTASAGAPTRTATPRTTAANPTRMDMVDDLD